MKEEENTTQSYFSELQPEFEMSDSERSFMEKIIVQQKNDFNQEVINNQPKEAVLKSLLNKIQEKKSDKSNVLLFSIPVFKLAAMVLMLVGFSSILKYTNISQNKQNGIIHASFDSIFAFSNDSSITPKAAHVKNLVADTSLDTSEDANFLKMNQKRKNQLDIIIPNNKPELLKQRYPGINNSVFSRKDSV